MKYHESHKPVTIRELEKLITHLKGLRYPKELNARGTVQGIMYRWIQQPEVKNVCHTVGCIAGEYALMRRARGIDYDFDFENYMRKHTKLSDVQTGAIVRTCSWPKEYRSLYAKAHTIAQERDVMVKRLRHMLKEGR